MDFLFSNVIAAMLSKYFKEKLGVVFRKALTVLSLQVYVISKLCIELNFEVRQHPLDRLHSGFQRFNFLL